uniref:Non-haem dioxygenase N-terminal domain-containing protein n=1 Tax=Oryza brachyantha TaxID=4533 RepID=J3MSR9_ORYBR
MATTVPVSGSDRLRDLQAFDDTKAGVKGLVDAGVTTIPYFFRHPPDPLPVATPSSEQDAAIPVIDIDLANKRPPGPSASSRWSNTACPGELMDEMLAAVRRFNEDALEAKVPYYTRDTGRKVRFKSNFDLFRSPAAGWRDTLVMEMAPEAPSPEEIPPACRGVAVDNAAAVRTLGERLFELLSEALGLHTAHLGRDAGCMDGLTMAGVEGRSAALDQLRLPAAAPVDVSATTATIPRAPP